MKVGAHPRLLLDDPYPVSWEKMYLLLRRQAPEVTPEDIGGVEVVRAWREHAADAEAQADVLDELLTEGWRLVSVGGLLSAHRNIKTLEEALEQAQREDVLGRGCPIEICVAQDGAGVLAAGGLLAGVDPHLEIYPPRTLPALVVLKPSGEQHLVETPQELREVVAGGVTQIARWLEGEQGLLQELKAPELPGAVRDLAAGIERDGTLPRRVLIDTVQDDMQNRDSSTASVTVTPVSGAVWSAVLFKVGVQSAAMLEFPFEGIGHRLRGRGMQVAAELLGGPSH
jgi:hypothetical protein